MSTLQEIEYCGEGPLRVENLRSLVPVQIASKTLFTTEALSRAPIYNRQRTPVNFA